MEFPFLFVAADSSHNIESEARNYPMMHLSDPQAFQWRAYIDQVIHRKAKILLNKCNLSGSTGNVLIELSVLHQGTAQSRLVSTDLTNPNIIKCILSVFNRIQFQKLKRNTEVQRIYHFIL